MLHRFDLRYQADSANLFSALRDFPLPVFLDSGQRSRYDILTADPYRTLTAWQTRCVLQDEDGKSEFTADPLEVIREQLQAIVTDESHDLPFCGGAIGYWSYDFGRWLELGTSSQHDFPDLLIGFYDWAIIVDHQQQSSYLVAQNIEQLQTIKQRLFQQTDDAGVSHSEPLNCTTPVRSNISIPEYHQALQKIHAYLQAGDCYQVNFAQCFSATVQGDSWQTYQQLSQQSPAPFGAYLQTPYGDILSNSPERFLRIDGDNKVCTQPIKGTRPRCVDPVEDKAVAENLKAHPKDRAENLMIVDLLRNDLGKVCEVGSIQVPELFALHSFATVHHLISTVQGQLTDGCDALDLLRAAFPGGSITGAPKHRAMQIIDELEPTPRKIYCGSIGYISFDGQFDSNIAIRTLLRCGETIQFWAGGGIVVDSDIASEYQESLDKAQAFFQVLGEEMLQQN